MISLQYFVSRTLKPLRSKTAYKEALLFCDWEAVVGPEYAKGYNPVEIYSQNGHRVLKLVTSSSGMATARYLEPVMLQRINQFFGAPYIAAIKTAQGQLKRLVKKQKLADTPDPSNLEEALKAIGRHVNG